MPAKTEYERLVIDGRDVAISNPRKVLFPEAGHTKLDVVRYYLAVAEGAGLVTTTGIGSETTGAGSGVGTVAGLDSGAGVGVAVVAGSGVRAGAESAGALWSVTGDVSETFQDKGDVYVCI